MSAPRGRSSSGASGPVRRSLAPRINPDPDEAPKIRKPPVRPGPGLFGYLKRLMVLLVLIAGAYIGYHMWKTQDFSKEGLQNAVKDGMEEIRKANLDKKFDKLKGGISEFSKNVQDGFEKIDWSNLREELNLSDSDLEKYYDESLSWVFSKDENLDGKDGAGKNPSAEAGSDKEKAAAPQEDNSVGGTAPTKENAPPKAVEAPPRVPPQSYTEGKKLLAKARDESRKAMPGMQDSKIHLKKATEFYKQSSAELSKALKDPALSAEEKKDIDLLLPKINQQVYWGHKLSPI